MELKKLTENGIPHAVEKAERYRLLNEPGLAESICLDILAVDPGHQKAIVTLLLAQTDSFAGAEPRPVAVVKETLSKLSGEYEQAYYGGIILERQARAKLDNHLPGGREIAHGLLTEAMTLFERAERVRPAANDDALLRWNTCARLISEQKLEAGDADDEELGLE